MMNKFQPEKFIDDYNRWQSMAFLTDEADKEEVYDLRYDLYEVDMNYAGSWIRLVQSNFKDVDLDLDDNDIQSLLSRAMMLRNKVSKNDAVLVDSYIEYLDLMQSLYENYKRLQI